MSIHGPDKHINHCPLCKATGFSSYRLGLLKCAECGLVISSLVWQEQANEQMEEEWFGENYKQRKSSSWVEWFETLNNRNTLSRLEALPNTRKRLLEIGVGSGNFLKAAKDRGYVVMGCDLSEPICRFVEKEVGVSMHCGPLAPLIGETRFDIVVMNHVLEHVQLPVQFLQDVYRLLAPDGIVHIAVPNIACWEAYLSGWTSYEPYHLTYFDRQTLIKVVDTAGLACHSLYTKDSFSGWFLALLRTGLGVNRAHGVITGPVGITLGNPVGRRNGFIEHAYRLAMILAGGGALAFALDTGEAGPWRRDHLRCPKAQRCQGKIRDAH